MGNASSSSSSHSSSLSSHDGAPLGRKSRRISREQLRARSFYRREQAAGEPRDDDAHNNNHNEEEGDGEDAYVAKLEASLGLLREKCAALESQNILVPVQQLDLFTRYFSVLLSLLVLWCYGRFFVFGLLPRAWKAAVGTVLARFRREYGCGPTGAVAAAVFLSHAATMRALQAVSMVLPFVYDRWTHGSTHRRFQVFCVAFVVILRVRMCRKREELFLQPDPSGAAEIPRFGEACTNDGIWESNYEISGRYLYLSVVRLRGLWTKTAQYLSSRADFMPVAYIRELGKLQDSCPATPWEDVRLPPRVAESLSGIETTPIASASIGQVHKARRRKGDQKVVVKVRHPHAKTLLNDDFWSLKTICKIVSWLEPEYAFLEILMNEWATEAKKELDFRHEAAHLREANEALASLQPTPQTLLWTTTSGVETAEDGTKRRIPFRVEVPEPIEELSNEDVLVMNYCEGCRIDDFAQLEEWGLPREAVMDGVAQAFAHFMYCSTIFNGDPHPGNLLVRPGTTVSQEGFTIVVLDWGLAKRLPEQKRVAFCQMVYAASTLDYGLLLDSYKTIGLKMKREDAGQSMEDMRFFLRDMAPRGVARKRIKSRMKKDKARVAKSQEKVPMESKAYPGEFFFFVRVNELLQGLGSRFGVTLAFLDALRPYAEKGLRMSTFYDEPTKPLPPITNHNIENPSLQKKVGEVLEELRAEGNLEGGQVCVINKDGGVEADVAEGSLGGLKSHTLMRKDALILGYSTTKAVAATLAHAMVLEGYLSYDEPVCERVWKKFCPTEKAPEGLASVLGLTPLEAAERWGWKRRITLRHILSHSAGMWACFPAKLTIRKMASCEECVEGFEYDPSKPEETVLPTSAPTDDGSGQAYHFMSFGWLVAGTLCGAYAEKHGGNATFRRVYEELLEPKLSRETLESGFRPLGGAGSHVLAQTVTSDVRASEIIQRKRQAEEEANDDKVVEANSAEPGDGAATDAATMMKMFQGKEFLLDPRIWNSMDAIDANVPAAGGRFSARGLAHFYHDLASGKIFDTKVMDEIVSDKNAVPTTGGSALQGVTNIANDSGSGGGDNNNHTKMGLGYQLISTDRDRNGSFSGVGHAGVGGSIGFIHRPTGMAISVMLNKADAGQEVTMRILRTIATSFQI